jgi:hypothetical protein
MHVQRGDPVISDLGSPLHDHELVVDATESIA